MKRLTLIFTIAGLGLVLLGGFAGWQVYQGHELSLQYTKWAQQASAGSSAGGGGASGASATGPTMPAVSAGSGGGGATPGASLTSPASGTSSVSPEMSSGGSPPRTAALDSGASYPNGSPVFGSPTFGTPVPASVDYKALMQATYQESIQTMYTIRANTYSLKAMKLSLSSYKGSILQAKATFASALTFAQAHPPANPALTSSYRNFVAGLTLAYQAMDVVLNGIAGLNPADLYAAREMGATARDKVVAGYGTF